MLDNVSHKPEIMDVIKEKMSGDKGLRLNLMKIMMDNPYAVNATAKEEWIINKN